MKIRNVCVLGGTGFIGHKVVDRLHREGKLALVPTRRRERNRDMLVLPGVRLVQVESFDETTLRQHLRHCDAIINLVGILNGSAEQFSAAHAELPRRLVSVCRDLGIRRLLHVSALNANPEGPSQYLRTKGLGESAVLAAAEHGIQATVLRPSIVFGPGDGFFNLFATLSALSPVLPVARPQTRFAPVYVGDVAEALVRCLDQTDTAGKVYELCGPDTWTFRELVNKVTQMTKRRRLVLGLPDSLAKLQAMVFERLPGQLVTSDNLASLQCDSVCSSNGLLELDIEPTPVDRIMPQYFAGLNHRSHRFHSMRRSSRHDR